MKKIKILIASVFAVSTICAALFLGTGDAWASGSNCKLDSSTDNWDCPVSKKGNCWCGGAEN